MKKRLPLLLGLLIGTFMLSGCHQGFGVFLSHGYSYHSHGHHKKCHRCGEHHRRGHGHHRHAHHKRH